jgi:hypothetical protein
MAHDAAGDRRRATDAYREALKLRDAGDAHARARGYLKKPYVAAG